MKTVINRNVVKLSIFLFFAIFAPPIIPRANFVYFVAIFSIANLFIMYRRQIEVFLGDRQNKKFNIRILMLICYYLIQMIISISLKTQIVKSNYINIIYRFSVVILLFEPICMYIIGFCHRHKLSFEQFIDALAESTLYEFFFCILTLISKPAKQFLTNIMIQNTGYYETIKPWVIESRFWGFAASMTDYFGYTLGIIGGVCTIYAFMYKKKYLFYVFIILFMTVLNSTTGLVIIAIFALFKFIDFLKKRTIRRTNLSLIITLTLSLPVMIIILRFFAPIGYQKIFDNVYQIFNPAKVKASNTAINDLFSSRFWQLPDSMLSIILGTGHSILTVGYEYFSDVGYVNDIWSFGIIGLIIYIPAYLKFIYSCVNRKNSVVAKSLIIAFLIFNIKGVALGCNSGALVTLIIAYCYKYLQPRFLQYKA